MPMVSVLVIGKTPQSNTIYKLIILRASKHNVSAVQNV